MTRDRVAALCRETFASLPAESREALRNVTIVVADRPGATDLARGAAPGHRGYFFGTRLESASPAFGGGDPLPDPDEGPYGEVRLFRANIPDDEAAVRTVLLHELAHALGHDEDEIVHVMGLGL